MPPPSGSTVTRKATWTASTILGPGKRILDRERAPVSTPPWPMRPIRVGSRRRVGRSRSAWSAARRSMRSAGETRAARSSREPRRPRRLPARASSGRRAARPGTGPTRTTTLRDWFVQGAPSPQGLAAPAVPAPGPRRARRRPPCRRRPRRATPTPTATPDSDRDARRQHRRRPPTPTPTPARRRPQRRHPLRRRLRRRPRRRRRRPDPDSDARPRRRSPTPRPIAEARASGRRHVVTIEGVLTTPLGALESGHGGFVQDASGGIALYLEPRWSASWPAGTTVTVEGTISSRFSQRTLRISESALVRRSRCRPAGRAGARDRRRRRAIRRPAGSGQRHDHRCAGPADRRARRDPRRRLGHGPGGHRAGCRRAA